MYKLTYKKSINQFISLIINTKKIENEETLNIIQKITKNANVVLVSIELINYIIEYYRDYIVGLRGRQIDIDCLHGTWPALETINFMSLSINVFDFIADNLSYIETYDCKFCKTAKWNHKNIKTINIIDSNIEFKNVYLPNLEKLSLEGSINSISGYMPKLEELDLCNCNIKNTEFLNNYENIRQLNISANRGIKKIKFTKLKKLIILFIQSTNIQNFLPIKELTNLFILHHNKLSTHSKSIPDEHIDEVYKSLINPKLPASINDIISFYYKRMKLEFDLKNNRNLERIYT